MKEYINRCRKRTIFHEKKFLLADFIFITTLLRIDWDEIV